MELREKKEKLFSVPEEECPVCFNATSNKTLCNHFLCKECIVKIKTNNCPICRGEIVKEADLLWEREFRDLINQQRIQFNTPQPIPDYPRSIMDYSLPDTVMISTDQLGRPQLVRTVRPPRPSHPISSSISALFSQGHQTSVQNLRTQTGIRFRMLDESRNIN